MLDHMQCLVDSDRALRQWRFDELLDMHDARQTVSEEEQRGTDIILSIVH